MSSIFGNILGKPENDSEALDLSIDLKDGRINPAIKEMMAGLNGGDILRPKTSLVAPY